MTETGTPGQVAFAAYVAPGYALVPPAARPRWDDLTPGQQRCWEAAAQAVLEAWQAHPRMEDTTP